MNTKEEIGRRVQAARREAGMTQGELGKAWGGRSHAAVSDVERGATGITASGLAELARILGKSVAYFYGEQPSAQYFRGGRDESGAIVDRQATADFLKHMRQRRSEGK